MGDVNTLLKSCDDGGGGGAGDEDDDDDDDDWCGGRLLFVQYGGFRKLDGAKEFAALMHNLMTHALTTFLVDDTNTGSAQLTYSIYIIRDSPACFMCAGSKESPSFHVTAILRGCLFDTYCTSIRSRLERAALSDGICTRAKQCCGYVIRRIPTIIYRSMRDAWHGNLIVAPPTYETPAIYGCFS